MGADRPQTWQAMRARILVIGRSGQLATELMRLSLPAELRLDAWGRDRFDLTNLSAIPKKLHAARPDAVINASAYTAVDKAESEPEAAMALNRDGPGVLAQACADLDIPYVHISTDYVFDGTKPSPYIETDPKAPISVYGRSKSEGEDRVLECSERAAVIRTAWVYSSHGTNFMRTMLRLAETRGEVGVVADQFGRPTWARDLAETSLAVVLRALERDPAARGLLHYAGAGDASWADFAEAIFEGARSKGARSTKLNRIATSDFPTPTKRPSNSRLDTTKIRSTLGIVPRDWREACALCLGELLG